MAENQQEPQFLGGGPKFNRAGVGAPEAEAAPAAPVSTSVRIRTTLIVVALVALVIVLYWISSGPNGLKHVGGGGGVSPSRHTPGPDSETNP